MPASGRAVVTHRRRHRPRGRHRGEPERTSVRRGAAHRPGVVRLVGQPIVFRETVTVPIRGREPGEDRLDRREDLRDEVNARWPGRDGVAPRLQDELRPEVLPAVHVLEPVPVRPDEGIVRRAADVVRDGAADLAWRRFAGCLDRDDLGIVDRDRREQVADSAQLELREQGQERERRVEVDVDRVVERVVDAFEERESADVVGCRLGRPDLASLPEGAAVDEKVELVEERRDVPVRTFRIGEVRGLPRLDRTSPLRRLGEGVPGEVEGPRA